MIQTVTELSPCVNDATMAEVARPSRAALLDYERVATDDVSDLAATSGSVSHTLVSENTSYLIPYPYARAGLLNDPT